MYTLKSIFSSMIQKVKSEQEKKPIYVNWVNGRINGVNGRVNGVNGAIIRDYATFDQEVISRTNYLLQNK